MENRPSYSGDGWERGPLTLVVGRTPFHWCAVERMLLGGQRAKKVTGVSGY